MKPLIRPIILAALVSGGCDSEPHQERTATPASSSEATEDIEALVQNAQQLLSQDELDQSDVSQIRKIDRMLTVQAWKDGSSLRKTLEIISKHREDPKLIDWLHTGLNPYGKLGLLENNDALKAETTRAIASTLLQEPKPDVKRLYLSLLQVHTSRGRKKEDLHLDAETVSQLVGEWDSLKDEKGRYGLPASSFLLMVYRRYASVNEDARRFLLALARDKTKPIDLRARALSACKWWPKGSEEHVSFVKEFLAPEEPSEIRVGAVRLLDPLFSSPADQLKESAPFNLLRELAEKDPDPKVRMEAGGSFLNLDDPQTIKWLADVLKGEKNQEVRAGILSGFPLLGYENRETNYAALRLLAQLFKNESHSEVQKAAVVRYLRLAHFSLVVWEKEESEASLDPVVLESLLGMAENIKKVSPPRETRLEIKERLETDFEKRFPVLLQISEYQELKEYLDE